jgi:hypothetical protein
MLIVTGDPVAGAVLEIETVILPLRRGRVPEAQGEDRDLSD